LTNERTDDASTNNVTIKLENVAIQDLLACWQAGSLIDSKFKFNAFVVAPVSGINRIGGAEQL
jgi:hypothetical protein